jgi:glycosyltransferase involved in cell wall biosynthesis
MSARQGYGAAIKTGITSAQGGYVAFYDVDGTYDPIVLPNMIDALDRENAEMVCGDRLSKCEHMPVHARNSEIVFLSGRSTCFIGPAFTTAARACVFSLAT